MEHVTSFLYTSFYVGTLSAVLGCIFSASSVYEKNKKDAEAIWNNRVFATFGEIHTPNEIKSMKRKAEKKGDTLTVQLCNKLLNK